MLQSPPTSCVTSPLRPAEIEQAIAVTVAEAVASLAHAGGAESEEHAKAVPKADGVLESTGSIGSGNGGGGDGSGATAAVGSAGSGGRMSRSSEAKGGQELLEPPAGNLR